MNEPARVAGAELGKKDRMAFGRRLVAAVVCAPLLVGGCADDPEPKLAPPDDTPTSVSSSPSPSPTREPWEKKTNAGAVAFAKHWIDVFSLAVNSGDSDELRELSDPGCKTCAAVAGRIDSIEGAGGYYKSPGWEVLQAVPSRGTPQGEAIVALRVRQGKEEFRESDDAEVIRNPMSKATYEATIHWAGGRWRMSELRLLA